MAKRYTSTINVNCWKEHTCSCCGATYSYQFIRTVKGTARTAEGAQTNARANVTRTLERDTDMHACPTCGIYQADMIGQRQAARRNIVFWIALIVFAIVLITRTAHGVQANIATDALAIVCGAVALIQLALELYNPNKDPQANLKASQQSLASGKLRARAGQVNARTNDFASVSRGPIHLLALLAVVAAVVPAYLPEGIRQVRKWPLNKETYPPVLGPGDVARVYMPDSISSIKGYWRGRPAATLDSADGITSVDLHCETNQNDWGSTIYAKDSETNDTSHPWVDITLPETPELANKTVTIAIDIDLDYPESSGSSNFRSVTRSMSHDLTVDLGPAQSGAQYTAIWWQGSWAATVASLGGCVVLLFVARKYQRSAKPTRAYT